MAFRGTFRRSIFLCVVYVVSMLIFPGAAYSLSSLPDYRYVVSIDFPSKQKRLDLGEADSGLRVYWLTVKIKGQIYYRARIGFFDSRRKATEFVHRISKKYKTATVDTVKKHDSRFRLEWYNSSVKQESINSGLSRAAFLLSAKETENVMEQARKAVIAQDYQRAIKLYTKVLSRGSAEHKQDAQEYLGVTREKNGQYAHAKAEYEEYLRLYPKGEGAERVRMRLNSILTASLAPRKRLSKTSSSESTVWSMNGYFTEFYEYDKYEENGIEGKRSFSATSVGVFGRRRSNSSDLKMQLTGTYLQDLDESEDSRKRLTSLYVDYANRPKTVSLRLGRQRHTRSGVLGRMDGLWADYQFHPQWKLNFVAGYPVNLIETNKIQTNRTFYGYSLDIGPFGNYLDFNIFQIKQEVDGLTDREAVGGEIRYISPENIFFTLVDYDTYFDELNKVFVMSTLRFKNQSTLTITYDSGKSPYMLTTNALQGQSFQTIKEMSASFTEQEIKQIAIDRTAETTALGVNWTRPLSKKYTISLDYRVSSVSATVASAGIPETPASGDENFYMVQLIGNDVLVRNDTLVGSINYAKTDAYKRTTYSVNERMDLAKKWRLKTGLLFRTTDEDNGAESRSYEPSVGIDYRYSRSLLLECALAYTRSSSKGDTLPIEDEGTRLSLGLVYDF